jgi:integrase
MRILDRAEIGKLLVAAGPRYRPLLATAVFTGLRQGELLGLTWADVNFADGVVHVRKALDRSGERVEPKTANAVRDVVLMPTLGRLLREHKLASAFARPTDYVFASYVGTPLYWRNVSKRGLEVAVKRAGLDCDGRARLRFHDLRHTFASLLIAEGSNVVFASRQLGHASPRMNLDVYAHLFDRAEHAQRASDALEAGFAALLSD